jgi:hypothetical protein
MITIQLPETANSANVQGFGLTPPSLESYFVAPQGRFFRLPIGNLQGAKLGNIPDIPRVLPAWTQVRSESRSGSFAPRI